MRKLRLGVPGQNMTVRWQAKRLQIPESHYQLPRGSRHLGLRASKVNQLKLLQSRSWAEQNGIFGSGPWAEPNRGNTNYHRCLTSLGHRRRICPGLPVVEHQLWLAISQLLWSFTFHALPDEPISLQEYEGTLLCKPLPFRLKLVPWIENLQETLRIQEEIVLWCMLCLWSRMILPFSIVTLLPNPASY